MIFGCSTAFAGSMDDMAEIKESIMIRESAFFSSVASVTRGSTVIA